MDDAATDSGLASAEAISAAQFSVPEFARTCFDAASDAWGASFKHPFLTALIDGTLDRKRFRFYQMQDAKYLEAYADACSLISARLNDPERKLWFIEAARLALVVERELHTEYGRILGYTTEDIAQAELTPDNRAYQNHLLVTCQRGTLLEAVAALSPCPWLYADIGQRVSDLIPRLEEQHPFRDWLLTYADPSFITYTNELLSHLQFLAELYPDSAHRSSAIEAFVLSTRYEYMFWDQAWNAQQWPDFSVSGVSDVQTRDSLRSGLNP